MQSLEGTCNCSEVAFAIAAPLPNLYQCHCSLCRKQTGAASNAATIVDANKFAFLKGTENISTWQKDSGFQSHFCNQCGSPVPNSILNGKYVWIPVGLLDEVDSTVVAHLNVDSKANWDSASCGEANLISNMPEDLEQFIHSLNT